MSFHGGKTFVYFIAPKIGGPIKIGVSVEPIERLTSLMAWAPYKLEILATAPGTWHDEQTIHRIFKEHWSHSEWFRPHPDIYALINDVRASGQIPERFRWADGKLKGIPRLPRRPWSEKAKANARKVHQERWDAIKASRAARDEIVAFLDRTGMTPDELDTACDAQWVVRHIAKHGECQHGAERIANVLVFIRAHEEKRHAA